MIKCISRVELQMFLEFAPAYFGRRFTIVVFYLQMLPLCTQSFISINHFHIEYMAKAYYHNLPTVLCKILGIYTIRYDNRETGKKVNYPDIDDVHRAYE